MRNLFDRSYWCMCFSGIKYHMWTVVLTVVTELNYCSRSQSSHTLNIGNISKTVQNKDRHVVTTDHFWRFFVQYYHCYGPKRSAPAPTLVSRDNFTFSVNLGGRRGWIQHAGSLFLPGGRQWAWQRADPQPWTGDEARVTAAFRSRRCDVCWTVRRSSTLPIRPGRRQRVHVRLHIYSRRRQSRQYSDHPRLSVILYVWLHVSSTRPMNWRRSYQKATSPFCKLQIWACWGMTRIDTKFEQGLG